MKLDGSCHCGKVKFTVEAYAPVPFMRCYCSICRKTAGTGGFAINLGAKFDTLMVAGQEHITRFNATIREKGKKDRVSTAFRHFCKHCGTALWLWDPNWPDLVHPHAGAIDTPLPLPPSSDHILVDSKPYWVEVHKGRGDRCYAHYPEESLEEWHRRHGKLSKVSKGDSTS